MIEKSRLEGLIEQGATIYRAYADVCVEEFKLNKDYKVSTAHLWKKLKHSAFKGCGYPLDQLFETKEDAEEYAEFGNITRTEKLPYVSWEKFKNKEGNYSFKVYPYDYYCYTDGRYVRIKQYYGSLDRIVFTKPLTRENYNEARRLCVKLFKGED